MKDLVIVHSMPCWLPLTATWLYNQVRYQPRNVESQIVCESTDNVEQFQLDNVHSLTEESRLRWYLDKGFRKLKLRNHLGLLERVASRYKAQILHSHWGDVAWRDMGAARKRGMKHVVTFYGKDVNYYPKEFPVWKQRYQELFDHIDLVLCEGPHMADCICELGCPREKLRVQTLGVELDTIAYQPRSWRPGETLRFLLAASFREKKGFPYGLEAIGRFRKDYNDIHVTVIGDASSDVRSHTEKEKILAAIRDHNLSDVVEFLGYQPYSRLFEEAYNSHIFVSPSVHAEDGDTEGGAPVTIIEMVATGMPVISTTHCDIPHVILDGEGGNLAPERDASALADNIATLASNPEGWRTMLDHARKRIEEEFDVRKQAIKLHYIYQGLIQ